MATSCRASLAPVPAVVCIGSLNVDLVVRLARMPGVGETVTGHTLERHLGGKGLNQALAAARAGADVAIESAGFTLVKGDLNGIVRARRLSRATMRNIKQNLFFALVYNAAGVPIAAGVLYPFFGILVSPIFAAAAMSLSSISVITNALRLRRTSI